MTWQDLLSGPSAMVFADQQGVRMWTSNTLLMKGFPAVPDKRAKVAQELREKEFAESDHGMQWSKSTCWIAWGSNIVRIFWLPLLDISQARQICSRQKWITVTVFAPLTFFTQKSAFETAGVTSGFNNFKPRPRVKCCEMGAKTQCGTAGVSRTRCAAASRDSTWFVLCHSMVLPSTLTRFAIVIVSKAITTTTASPGSSYRSNRLRGTICSKVKHKCVGYAPAWVEFTSVLHTHHDSSQLRSEVLPLAFNLQT